MLNCISLKIFQQRSLRIDKSNIRDGFFYDGDLRKMFIGGCYSIRCWMQLPGIEGCHKIPNTSHVVTTNFAVSFLRKITLD